MTQYKFVKQRRSAIHLQMKALWTVPSSSSCMALTHYEMSHAMRF